MLTIIGLIILAIFIYLFYKHYTVGAPYQAFLISTQSELILRHFPNLTNGDLHDFMTTSACRSIRDILRNQYYHLYTQKQFKTLTELMDKAMIRALVYVQIESWVVGMEDKQNTINFLNEHNLFEGQSSLSPHEWR